VSSLSWWPYDADSLKGELVTFINGDITSLRPWLIDSLMSWSWPSAPYSINCLMRDHHFSLYLKPIMQFAEPDLQMWGLFDTVWGCWPLLPFSVNFCCLVMPFCECHCKILLYLLHYSDAGKMSRSRLFRMWATKFVWAMFGRTIWTLLNPATAIFCVCIYIYIY